MNFRVSIVLHKPIMNSAPISLVARPLLARHREKLTVTFVASMRLWSSSPYLPQSEPTSGAFPGASLPRTCESDQQEPLYAAPRCPPKSASFAGTRRGAGLRGHRVGHRGHGPRHDHDPRPGLLLWRPRPQEEPRLDDRPVLRDLRRREFGVGSLGIHARPGAVSQRLHRE